MLYPHKRLDVVVKEMRSLGELLVPYSRPRLKDDADVGFLKTKDVCVDGYSMVLSYSKSDYDVYHVETLQILGKYVPFLPFVLICKIGKRFFGEEFLGLAETFSNNRKIYCWTVFTDKSGKAYRVPEMGDARVYEGFSYSFLDGKYVNFY